MNTVFLVNNYTKETMYFSLDVSPHNVTPLRPEYWIAWIKIATGCSFLPALSLKSSSAKTRLLNWTHVKDRLCSSTYHARSYRTELQNTLLWPGMKKRQESATPHCTGVIRCSDVFNDETLDVGQHCSKTEKFRLVAPKSETKKSRSSMKWPRSQEEPASKGVPGLPNPNGTAGAVTSPCKKLAFMEDT